MAERAKLVERIARILPEAAIAAVFAVMSVGCGPMRMRPVEPRTQFASAVIETDDGWYLAAERTRMEGRRPDRPLPVVLLVAGGNCNTTIYDCDLNSLTKYLGERGFDCWAVNLRGAGNSLRPGASITSTMQLANVAGVRTFIPQVDVSALQCDWTMDDYIERDIPAAVDTVLELTGRKKLQIIGFGLAGMASLAYLEGEGTSDKVASLVTIASAMTVPKPASALLAGLAAHPEYADFARALSATELPEEFTGILGRKVAAPPEMLFFARENVSPSALARFLYRGTVGLSPGVLRQFRSFLVEGCFTSADGKRNYTEQLERIETPLLAIAGNADNLALPEGVRHVYQHVSSEQKRFKVFGLAFDAQSDYGHLDLLLGRQAPNDVYPVIRKWLKEHM